MLYMCYLMAFYTFRLLIRYKSLGPDLSLITPALCAVIFKMFRNHILKCDPGRLIVGSYHYLIVLYCCISLLTFC